MLQTAQAPGVTGALKPFNSNKVATPGGEASLSGADNCQEEHVGDGRDLEETRDASFPDRGVEKGKERGAGKGRKEAAEPERGKSLKQNKPRGGIVAGQECSPVRSD